jgi:ADP-ribosylglycohydrolase
VAGCLRGLLAGGETGNACLALATASGLARLSASRRQPPVALVHGAYDAWLARPAPAAHATLSPVCREVLCEGVRGTLAEPINQSRERGALERTLPAGLVAPPGHAFDAGAELAAMTHGHPAGYLPAAFFADVVAGLVSGSRLAGAVAAALRTLDAWPGAGETRDRLWEAREYAAGHVSPARALAEFGAGGDAPEAAAMALYCALRAAAGLGDGHSPAQAASALTAGLAAARAAGEGHATVEALTGALLGTLLGAGPLAAARPLAPRHARGVASLARRLAAVPAHRAPWPARPAPRA